MRNSRSKKVLVTAEDIAREIMKAPEPINPNEIARADALRINRDYKGNATRADLRGDSNAPQQDDDADGED